MLRRFLLPGLLALTLAASPLATAPARADAQDAALALLGIAAMVAIANELDDDGVKRNDHYRRDYYRRDDRRDDHAKYRYRHGNRFALPARCVVQMESRHGAREVVLSHCLKRTGNKYRALPEYCSAPRASRLLGRKAYRLNCLRREGYHVARGY
mgnify:CR=1 FL=1